MIMPPTSSSKTSYLCLFAPVIFALASAATFDPLSSILFWLALLVAGILSLGFLYLIIVGKFKLASVALTVGLLLVLLIPLDPVSLRMIQMREKIDVAFNGERYKTDAQENRLPDGSAIWIIGHQHLREFRLFYAETPQTFQGIASGFDSYGCKVSTRRVNEVFGLLTLDCIED